VPVETSAARCKWFLVRNNEQFMILLCTWDTRASRVELTLDGDAPGVQPEEARNVDHGEAIEVRDGAFRFSMPGYGVRMFQVR
jgi:hypothetical protein